MKTNDKLPEHAAAAVANVEALPLGEPYADPLRAAELAVEALRIDAAARLFPVEIEPLAAAALLDLETFSGELSTPERAASLHGRALDGAHDELAQAIRSPRGRLFLEAALARYAMATNRDAAGSIPEGSRRFERLIAADLHARGRFAPFAATLAETIPELEARIAAARGRHEEHARAEAERIERERVESDTVLEEQRREHRRELAARIRALPSNVQFTITTGDGIEHVLIPRNAASLLEDGKLAADHEAALERQAAPFARVEAAT